MSAVVWIVRWGPEDYDLTAFTSEDAAREYAGESEMGGKVFPLDLYDNAASLLAEEAA